MELDLTTLFCECLAPDASPVGLPRDKLVDQKRLFRHRICRFNQTLRDEIRYFVPETQNRRGLDSHHGSLRGNNVLEQFHITDRQSLRFAQQALGNLRAAAVEMLWDDDLVAKPVEQPDGLDADILVIEARKFVAKEKDASVRKRAIFICVNLVPPAQRNLIELRHRTLLSKTRKPLKQTGSRRICHQKIKYSGRDRGQTHGAREVTNKTRAHRNTERIVALLKPFSFKACHVNVERAL